MDSLTQIVLGAAVGEAVLGRKIGNRAMLWGGIAGTLPDLDVLSGLVTDSMSALAYHRAFTHSLPFAVLAAPLLGWVVQRVYAIRKHTPRYQYLLAILLFWLLLLGGSYLMPIAVYDLPAITATITVVFTAVGALASWLTLRRIANRHARIHVNPGMGAWTGMFFLAIVTHPLLDCFTAYGTQFFEPFTTARIAWNTVSVVDPLYTLPFLLLLLLAARYGAGTRVRRILNGAGLVLSSVYLLATVINHFNVKDVLATTLLQRGITANRTVIGPTIGNNLLWSGSAEAGTDTYYVGQYSLLDRRRTFDPLLRIEGRHNLLAPYTGDRELEILEWFTNGYYTVLPAGQGRVQLNDLRYGLLGSDPEDPASYLFGWTIDTTSRPVRVVEQLAGPKSDPTVLIEGLWERMLGQ